MPEKVISFVVQKHVITSPLVANQSLLFMTWFIFPV